MQALESGSQSKIGLGATAVLFGTAQAGLEIAGVVGGIGAARNAAGQLLQSANLPKYVFVPNPSVPKMMGQSGAVNIGGQSIESVSPEMRQAFQGNGYLDPISNKIIPSADGVRIDVDHIFPAKKIIDMPGFDTLTREQMTNILQDKLGFGNLQPLPQSLNASKGAKFGNDWTSYKGSQINNDYAVKLDNLQKDIRSNIQNQIDIYNNLNKRGY